MITLVPGTAELVRSFGQEIPHSARILAAVDGDRVLGIVGVYPETARQVAFMTLTEELKKHPRVLIKAGRIFMKWVKDSKMPTHALCDEEINKAREYLEHWGFRRIYKGVYSWQA